jgi:transposase
MPEAYSTDLRTRVLAAVEAGENPDAVAARFIVGRATVYRWMTAARIEGRRAPKPVRGGPKPVIQGSVEAALVHMVTESNHLTLSECRDRLAEATGVRVHPCTVGRALRRLPWT